MAERLKYLVLDKTAFPSKIQEEDTGNNAQPFMRQETGQAKRADSIKSYEDFKTIVLYYTEWTDQPTSNKN